MAGYRGALSTLGAPALTDRWKAPGQFDGLLAVGFARR